MARIEHLREKTEVHRSTVHHPADASFHLFDEGGVTYLQIDTYGSAERQLAGKVSQTLQFGPDGIMQLRAILDRLG